MALIDSILWYQPCIPYVPGPPLFLRVLNAILGSFWKTLDWGVKRGAILRAHAIPYFLVISDYEKAFLYDVPLK